MTEAILAWINGSRDYLKGIGLLENSGAAPELLKRLRADDSTDNKRELFFNLRALLSGSPAPSVTPILQATPIIAVPHNKKAIQPVSAPLNDIAAAAKKDADLLYKEMQNKRALLFDLCPVIPSASENDKSQQLRRSQLAKEIVELETEVTAAYEKYRYASANGRLPDTQAPDDTIDPVDLYRKIQNLKKAISRWEVKPESAERSQHLADKTALLTKLQQQYDEATCKP